MICAVCLGDQFVNNDRLCKECAGLELPRKRTREAWRCPDCHKKRVRHQQMDREGNWYTRERYMCTDDKCGWYALLPPASGHSAVERARLASENI